MKLQLPRINIWSEAYMARALLRDRCSCAPDNFPTPWGNVYVGNVCLRHDERYDWIRGLKCGWRQRIRLKWMADRELGSGIREAFERQDIHVRFIPVLYREFVIMFNFPFRIVKEVAAALWRAIWFKG